MSFAEQDFNPQEEFKQAMFVWEKSKQDLVELYQEIAEHKEATAAQIAKTSACLKELEKRNKALTEKIPENLPELEVLIEQRENTNESVWTLLHAFEDLLRDGKEVNEKTQPTSFMQLEKLMTTLSVLDEKIKELRAKEETPPTAASRLEAELR